MVSPLPKVIPRPGKSIGMYAASCDRVVLVLQEIVSRLKIQPFLQEEIFMWQEMMFFWQEEISSSQKILLIFYQKFTAEYQCQKCTFNQGKNVFFECELINEKIYGTEGGVLGEGHFLDWGEWLGQRANVDSPAYSIHVKVSVT